MMRIMQLRQASLSMFFLRTKKEISSKKHVYRESGKNFNHHLPKKTQTTARSINKVPPSVSQNNFSK